MQPDRTALIAQIAESEVRPFRRTTPPHMHDDLMQEALIGAWKALEKLDGDRTPKEQRAWLGRASRSKVLSYLRYVQVRKREMPSTHLLLHGEKGAGGSADLLDCGREKQPAGTLAAAAHALRERAGVNARPDDEMEARELARRIDRAVGQTLASLTPAARATLEARLGMAEAPEIGRGARAGHVRKAREQLAKFGHAEGLDLDLGALIACQ